MNARSFTPERLAEMSPKEFRGIVSHGRALHTANACRGYAQANLAMVPRVMAFEFLHFCNRNPRPCPVLDVTEPGNPHPMFMAPEADLRTDLGKYRVYKNGKLVDEPSNIKSYWRDDLVAFLLGCSRSFDWLMRAANVKYRFIGAFVTGIPCVPVGPFFGHMFVSCRFFKGNEEAMRAIHISSRVPAVHGAPVHIGDPSAIGIKDLYGYRTEFLTEVPAPQEPDEVALYWGCGITPQAVALEAKLPFMITHYPGAMFITDRLVEELAVL